MTVFVECNPDETLAIALGVRRRAVVHGGDKGRVAKRLRENRAVVGLVDEDPGSAEPPTLSRFVEVSASHDVRLKIDREQNNRLIVICPRLEPWLIKTAKASNMRLEKDYNLSDNVQELDAMINHRLPNIERLLRELLAAKSARLLHLKALLSDRSA